MREQAALGVGDARLRGGGAVAHAERLALAAHAMTAMRVAYARLFARIKSVNRLNR